MIIFRKEAFYHFLPEKCKVVVKFLNGYSHPLRTLLKKKQWELQEGFTENRLDLSDGNSPVREKETILLRKEGKGPSRRC